MVCVIRVLMCWGLVTTCYSIDRVHFKIKLLSQIKQIRSHFLDCYQATSTTVSRAVPCDVAGRQERPTTNHGEDQRCGRWPSFFISRKESVPLLGKPYDVLLFPLLSPDGESVLVFL